MSRKVVALLVGQSNAGGRGALVFRPVAYPNWNFRIYMYGNNDVVVIAFDPTDNNTGQIDAVSNDVLQGFTAPEVCSGIPYAARFFERGVFKTDDTVELIQAALASSAVSQWTDPGGPLDNSTLFGNAFVRFKARVDANPGCLPIIIWYQGEADAQLPANPAYAAQVQAILDSWRTRVLGSAAACPAIVVELPVSIPPSGLWPQWNAIRAAQASLNGVSAIVVVQSPNGPFEDGLHLTTPAQIVLGKAEADAHIAVLGLTGTRAWVYAVAATAALDVTAINVAAGVPIVHAAGHGPGQFYNVSPGAPAAAARVAGACVTTGATLRAVQEPLETSWAIPLLATGAAPSGVVTEIAGSGYETG